MGWAELSAMEIRTQKIRLLASEITGLKARIDEKAEEASRLAGEIEAISLGHSPTAPTPVVKELK